MLLHALNLHHLPHFPRAWDFSQRLHSSRAEQHQHIAGGVAFFSPHMQTHEYAHDRRAHTHTHSHAPRDEDFSSAQDGAHPRRANMCASPMRKATENKKKRRYMCSRCAHAFFRKRRTQVPIERASRRFVRLKVFAASVLCRRGLRDPPADGDYWKWRLIGWKCSRRGKAARIGAAFTCTPNKIREK